MAVPETDLTLVLTEDFKKLVSYQVFHHGSPVSEVRLLGSMQSDSPPTVQVSTTEGVCTVEWRSERMVHFVKIAVAEMKILSDSNVSDLPPTIELP